MDRQIVGALGQLLGDPGVDRVGLGELARDWLGLFVLLLFVVALGRLLSLLASLGTSAEHALERERGVTVRVARMIPETGQLDADDLRRQITGRTRLVAIGAASNALGTINDIAVVSRLGHDAGALVFVDAVHYAPHRLVDVRAMGCDFLACSAYKFYGPHLGVLFGREEFRHCSKGTGADSRITRQEQGEPTRYPLNESESPPIQRAA